MKFTGLIILSEPNSRDPVENEVDRWEGEVLATQEFEAADKKQARLELAVLAGVTQGQRRKLKKGHPAQLVRFVLLEK